VLSDSRAGSETGRWTIDARTSVARFTMSYLVVATLKGSLGAIEGELTIDEERPDRSVVSAFISVSTMNTGNRLRDAHLRSGDFFDVERFPRITFQSARVDKVHDRRFRVVGDLTIRDITKEVELDAAHDESIDELGQRHARFTATTTLSRKEFGVGQRTPIETAGLIASDRVSVTLDIRATAA
jgi:polyisoprenoid-binding protein YceI